MLDSMEQLIQELNLLPRGCTVLCAVSGGADSICLLHALHHLRPKYGFRLAAAHYNHQLRGVESDRDASFVAQFVALCCGPQRLPSGETLPAVPLYSGQGDVAMEARRRGMGIEAAARELRYSFLRQTAREVGADRIATAHNADDNAETILFHLARGCGLRGLTGIPPMGNGLIRPLLTTPRRDIEAYLARHNLPYMADSSNDDDDFARNRIRHQVIPVLEGLYPGLAPRLAGTAALLREDEALLEEQARTISGQAILRGEELTIPASALGEAPQPLAARAARQLLERLTGSPDCRRVHLDDLLRLCRGDDPSARLSLPNGLTARREYDLLAVAFREEADLPEEVSLPLPGALRWGSWQITCEHAPFSGHPQGPWDFWLCREEVPVLTLRSRLTGDRLKLPGRPTKTVKKWCVDEQIPAHLRPLLPVFLCWNRVAAVAGLGPDQAFLPQKGAEAWHITIRPAESQT